MKTIRAEFRRFQDVSLHEIAGEIGCYVIWDSQAKAKVTYIGSGNLLKRISEHHKSFSLPLDGYVAIANSDDEAKIVEAIFIDLAKETDRGPTQNGASGAWVALKRFCKSEKLKIYVSGFDPLRPIKPNQSLFESKLIEVDFDREGEPTYSTSHWKTRKKMAA